MENKTLHLTDLGTEKSIKHFITLYKTIKSMRKVTLTLIRDIPVDDELKRIFEEINRGLVVEFVEYRRGKL